MKISLCIPMYNEAKIAADTARTLWDAMAENRRRYGWDFEILFADDGSLDDCGDRVCAVAAEGKDEIRVVGYEKNRGKGGAVREAVLASDGDIVIYTDCDLAYGTDVIAEAVLRYEDGVDAVIGSRRLDGGGYEGYTPLRKLASAVYFGVLKTIGGFHLSDSQCGFKSFRGHVARQIFGKCQTNGFAFDFEVLLLAEKLGASIAEMPVTIINHRASTVHVVRDSIRMVRDLLRIKKRVRRVTFEV
jgi:dolichyl-phosphate beta-glucosyltransferase